MSRYSPVRGGTRQDQESENTIGHAGSSEVPSSSGYTASNDYTESNGRTASNGYTTSNGYTASNEYTASDGYTARNADSSTTTRNHARNPKQVKCEMCRHMNPTRAPHCFSCSEPLPVNGEANTRRPASRQDPSSPRILCQMCRYENPIHLDYCLWCSQRLPKDANGLPAGVGAGVGGLALGVVGTLAVGAALLGEAVRPVRR